MAVQQAKVARSLVWTSLESFGLAGVALISVVVYARFLTPAELGIAAMALSVVQLANIFVEVPFHDAIIQRKELSREHFHSAFSASVVAGAAVLVLCWFGAPVAAALTNQPEMVDVLRGMSLAVPFLAVMTPLVAWHRREMEFRTLAVRSVVGRLVGGVAGIALAIAGAGMWSLVVQHVLMAASSCACLWLMMVKRPRWSFHLAPCAQLLRFGVFSTINTFVSNAIQRVFMLLVGTFLGSDAAGYFSLAFRSVDILRDFFASAVSHLSLSLFSRLQEDRTKLAAAFRSAIQFSCALMFPLFAGFAVCANEVVILVFGQRWEPAVPLVAIMAALTLQFFPRVFSSPMMNAAGKPAYAIVDPLVQVGFVIAGMVLLGRFGIYLACLIWALRLIASTPLDMLVLRHVTGVRLQDQWGGLLPIAMATAGMVTSVFITRELLSPHVGPLVLLVAMVATGMFVYPALLWLADRAFVGRLLVFLASAVHR